MKSLKNSIAAFAVLVGITATAALANGLPAGYGVDMPSRSKLTGNLNTGTDVDDFVFEAYPGQTVTVKLKSSKKSAANIGLDILRPDDTLLTGEEEGSKFKFGAAVTVLVPKNPLEFDPDTGEQILVEDLEQPLTQAKFRVDQTGTWKARVRILDETLPAGDTGEYTIQVKYNSPKKQKVASPTPTDDQYEFVIPAKGGATVAFNFKFKGANVQFNAMQAPDGSLIPDVLGKLTTKDGKFVKGKGIFLLPSLPQGDYRLIFDLVDGVLPTKANFSHKIKLEKGAKPRKGHLDPKEPSIPAVGGNPGPNVGGPGTLVTVSVLRAFDENAKAEDPVVRVGRFPLDNQTVIDNGGQILVTGRIPTAIGQGQFDISMQTATGQAAVLPGAFERVPPPRVFSIDPIVGTEFGGFEITITGENFRPGSMGVLIDGGDVPLGDLILEETDTTFRFISPQRLGGGKVTFGMRDLVSQLFADLPPNSFEYLRGAGISRVVPGLVPVLGGDSVFVKGTNFNPGDKVFLERADGTFEEITATQTTYQHDKLHSFIAPVRPKGEYEVYVEDPQGQPTPSRTIAFFTFADFTASLGVPAGADLRDAWTSALSDYDRDNDLDVILGRIGEAGASTESLVRIFENDGSGNLTDVTDQVMPTPTSTDDWRADRLWMADQNLDGYPDLYLTSSSTTVLSSTKSHTRILINERASASADASSRRFKDRTVDLMPAPRPGESGVSNTEGDNWRGKDMWVGDIDRGPAGPPEILITDTRVSEETSIRCTRYCSTGIAGSAFYSFYWGGSRAFAWDPSKRGGQGQYKFDHNFFPRKAGVVVNIGNPPPGVTIPACNTGTPCRGTFTPFTGERMTVGDLNQDGRPDIVVSGQHVVTVDGQPISTTQVAINTFSSKDGSSVTDVTEKLTELGGLLTADAIEIGIIGYADGNSRGSLFMAQASDPGTGGSALRVLRFEFPADEDEVAAFTDVTNQVLPPVGVNDRFQASDIALIDVEGDGDRDVVIVANAAPGPGEPAFRILRNTINNNQLGILREQFAGLISPLATASEPFDGNTLLIGDMDGDNAVEFIVTRIAPGEGTSQTRALSIDK